MGQHSSHESKHPPSCPALPQPLDGAASVVGPFTTHQFLQILAGACGTIAIAISMVLFFQHAINIRNPREQIKIMRIITIIPIFASVTFVGLCLGQGSLYLTPWLEIWECICVCTFFLLVLTYIHADPDTQLSYFETLPLWNRKKQVVGVSSAQFYKRTRIFVFQIIPVLTILAVIEVATEAAGVFCINSNSPRFAHIWMTAFRTSSNIMTIISIIIFCRRLRGELPGKNIWHQLFCFKTIIGLNMTQTSIFSIVAGQATPTDSLSYNDLSVGLPSTLIIIEMLGFSVLFHKCYTHRPYLAGGEGALSQEPVMSPWLAMAKAINPLEVFEGMMAAFTGKAGGKRAHRMKGDSYGLNSAKSQTDSETMLSRPAEAHYEEGTEYRGHINPFEDNLYHTQGDRAGADSPPRYG